MFLREPILHPRLRDPAVLSGLANTWDRGILVLPDALVPGAALAAALCAHRLQFALRHFHDQLDQSWSVDVPLPEAIDPQVPGVLYGLHRLMGIEGAALGAALTGRTLGFNAEALHLWALRKGAFVDHGKALAPLGGLDIWLVLEGNDWPEQWGGHLQREDGSTVRLRRGDLVLLDNIRFTVPLLRQHVATMLVRGWLPPVPQ